MKKNLAILFIASFAAGVLSGCDPAPSTTLAPDQQMPDTSKMSAEEINKLHSEASAGGSDRNVGTAPASGGVGRPGDTPSDRQVGGG